MSQQNEGKRPAKVAAKSVFEVDNSRLGIGAFTRPLLDHEARTFKRAWEMEALPGFEDFQLDAKQVSFVSKPEGVVNAWKTIDRLLAYATEPVRKAS
jgi:hypothetical protein